MSPNENRNKVFLIGRDISNSLSLPIQNAAFKESGGGFMYELHDLANKSFESFVSTLPKRSNLLGLNVTAPFKENIINYLSSIDRRSKSIGAVNTVKISNENVMEGFNTDYDGIMASLEKLGATRKKNALILGAGGAARACVSVLLTNGYAEITILNRTLGRARKMRKEFSEQHKNKEAILMTGRLTDRNISRSIQSCDLIINAISNSRRDYFPAKLDFARARRNPRIFDLGYKEQSLLLTNARRAGLEAMDGLFMLVVQAAKSFEIWTGRKAPFKIMMDVAEKARAVREEEYLG